MKKIFMITTVLILGIGSSFAMGSDKAVDQVDNHHQVKKSHEHLLVKVYSKADESSNVLDKITLENQVDYNIFYCNNENWCEVVDRDNGQVGWVSLDQLKQAQEKYANYAHKKQTLKKLVEYTKLQDQKIVQLQTAMMQMQKQFAYALQTQQAQINQLKQRNYYY